MNPAETPAKGTPKTQMCVVDIDHLQLLLPAAMGLKLLGLVQNAERVEMDYTHGHSSMKYQRVGNPSLRLEVLRPGQLEEQRTAAEFKSARKQLSDKAAATLIANMGKG